MRPHRPPAPAPTCEACDAPIRVFPGIRWCDSCALLAVVAGTFDRTLLFVSEHAQMRYAERILEIDPALVLVRPELATRCERGIRRIAADATWSRDVKTSALVLVARTRALVLEGTRVVTVLVADLHRSTLFGSAPDFGRRFLPILETEDVVDVAPGVA